jgi:CRP-like cAMP-binding protein
MTHHFQLASNLLLARLTPDALGRIAPSLALMHLEPAQVLAETHQKVDRVYFPHSGIISCVVELPGGGAIETGMIGKDGEWGASQALDDRISLNHVVIQLPGQASVMNADHAKRFSEEIPTFRKLLLSYDQFFTAHVQQTAACNAVHEIQPRLCKWLLRMQELAGDELPVTQEFLAQMMGVRRASVTQIAGSLQNAGMITYSRGLVRILDRGRIERAACGCNDDLRSHYQRMFGAKEP